MASNRSGLSAESISSCTTASWRAHTPSICSRSESRPSPCCTRRATAQARNTRRPHPAHANQLTPTMPSQRDGAAGVTGSPDFRPKTDIRRARRLLLTARAAARAGCRLRRLRRVAVGVARLPLRTSLTLLRIRLGLVLGTLARLVRALQQPRRDVATAKAERESTGEGQHAQQGGVGDGEDRKS